MIDGKTILITGGTGSFGKTVVNELLRNYQPKEIIVFSRDEKKQFDMRNRFDDSRLRFIIGDVHTIIYDFIYF
ncbi:MAG: polysaccharide biosynthesis protein [Actinobacteria bacterium]|nr:polysaccharide biosynthesis protein [Actinomycetota bacterium]